MCGFLCAGYRVSKCWQWTCSVQPHCSQLLHFHCFAWRVCVADAVYVCACLCSDWILGFVWEVISLCFFAIWNIREACVHAYIFCVCSQLICFKCVVEMVSAFCLNMIWAGKAWIFFPHLCFVKLSTLVFYSINLSWSEQYFNIMFQMLVFVQGFTLFVPKVNSRFNSCN